MTNDELLHKWVNKTITAEELEVFKLRPEYDSLTELYANTANLTGPSLDEEAMLSNILAQPKLAVTASSEQKTKRLFPSWMKYGIAASVLLLVGYFGTVLTNPERNMVRYDLAEGQMKEGTLPDLSTFSLGGNSSLSYDKSNWAETRKVTLEGDAYFKVEHGSTFSVETPTGVVEVLGTQFRVLSREGKLQVACSEGKVSVKSGPSDGYNEILLAGEKMDLTLDGSSKTWKKEVTKLRKVKLSEVILAIQEKYKVTIDSGAVDITPKVTCNFSNNNLDQALKTSLSPLGINFTRKDDQQILLIN